MKAIRKILPLISTFRTLCSPANLLRLKYNLPGSHHVFSVYLSSVKICKQNEQVTPIVPIIWTSNTCCSELQSKFPMPSESKLRSIYREVLQDRIINKKHIFYNIIIWLEGIEQVTYYAVVYEDPMMVPWGIPWKVHYCSARVFEVLPLFCAGSMSGFDVLQGFWNGSLRVNFGSARLIKVPQ